ncbi:MAG: hypothetical protein CCU26_19135, partial [Nitrospira sp. UW-LDO-01]
MIAESVSVTHCPKCQAQQSDGAEECIRCGIIFSKYKPLAAKGRLSPSRPAFTESKWFIAAKKWLIESDTTTESMTFYGRLVVFIGL